MSLIIIYCYLSIFLLHILLHVSVSKD